MKERVDYPIRIAHMVGTFPGGGVKNVVYNYYRAIDKKKYQFDIFYDGEEDVSIPDDLIKMGARFFNIPSHKDPIRCINELRRIFKQNHYLIVHSHMNTLSVFSLYAAYLEKVPIRIVHNHSVPGGNEYLQDCVKYILKPWSILFANYYFACSEKAGRWMFGNNRFDKNQVFVMKNAVDFDRFKHIDEEKLIQLKKKYHLEGKLVVGNIGRLTYAKNHEFLFEILKSLRTKNPNAVLLLVGEGELHNQINEMIRKNNLSDAVVLVGDRSDTENFYHLMDIMVLPSIFEGLSLTTVEAQISGIPSVVSYAVPKEAIISDGGVEYMDLSQSANDWANKIMACIGKEFSLNERSNNYKIEKAVSLLEEEYDKQISIIK